MADMPMTRPQECLAVIDGFGVKSCFTALPDGRILNFTPEGKVSATGRVRVVPISWLYGGAIQRKTADRR